LVGRRLRRGSHSRHLIVCSATDVNFGFVGVVLDRSGTFTALPPPPETGGYFATAVSADGTTIFGVGVNRVPGTGGFVPFKWTVQDPTAIPLVINQGQKYTWPISVPPPGDAQVSDDGTVAAGSMSISGAWRVVSPSPGTAEQLAGSGNQLFDVSGNGNRAVGRNTQFVSGVQKTEAIRWNNLNDPNAASVTFERLRDVNGTGADPTSLYNALASNWDASFIGGTTLGASPAGWVWSEANGFQSLPAFLTARGLTITGPNPTSVVSMNNTATVMTGDPFIAVMGGDCPPELTCPDEATIAAGPECLAAIPDLTQ